MYGRGRGKRYNPYYENPRRGYSRASNTNVTRPNNAPRRDPPSRFPPRNKSPPSRENDYRNPYVIGRVEEVDEPKSPPPSYDPYQPPASSSKSNLNRSTTQRDSSPSRTEEIPGRAPPPSYSSLSSNASTAPPYPPKSNLSLASKIHPLLGKFKPFDNINVDRPSRPVIVVFDFDCCIMAMHMWATFRDAPVGEIELNDDMFGDLPFFRWLIPRLSRAGVELAVATFGRQEVVHHAMCYAFGDNQTYFSKDKISSPARYGVPEGSNGLNDKNTQLGDLASQYDADFNDILFFDDTQENIHQAQTLGVTSVIAAPFNQHVWWGEFDGHKWCKSRGIQVEEQ